MPKARIARSVCLLFPMPARRFGLPLPARPWGQRPGAATERFPGLPGGVPGFLCHTRGLGTSPAFLKERKRKTEQAQAQVGGACPLARSKTPRWPRDLGEMWGVGYSPPVFPVGKCTGLSEASSEVAFTASALLVAPSGSRVSQSGRRGEWVARPRRHAGRLRGPCLHALGVSAVCAGSILHRRQEVPFHGAPSVLRGWGGCGIRRCMWRGTVTLVGEGKKHASFPKCQPSQ